MNPFRALPTALYISLATLALQAQPVPWQPWSPASFAKGKTEKKLVLVDAEATWCHWCHVMDEKTYSDPKIRALLQAHFVAIKADIDVHPDAHELFEDIGWPGTAIYGPDGTVLYRHRGFIPPNEFREVLEGFILDQKNGSLKPWAETMTTPKDTPPEFSDLASARDLALSLMDDTYDLDQGGWGSSQKYPIAANVAAAFAEAARRKDGGWRLRSLYTLKQQRAITDPVWGGVFQYSVGPTWHDVHFEKLTGLQAGYLENLAEAHRVTGDADFLKDADAVLKYLRRFMQHPDGGFSATMDADVGGYDKSVPFVDGHLFYALDDPGRVKRGLPRIDQRRYASVNGQMIAALASLQRSTGEETLLAEARAALTFADANLMEQGGYRHNAEAREAFFLGDQLGMLRGLLALHECTGESALLDRAEGLAAFMDQQFSDGKGLFRSRTLAVNAAPAIGAFAEIRTPFEDNGQAAHLLLRLYAFTGKEAHRERSKSLLRMLGSKQKLEDQGRWLGEFVQAADEALEEPSHLVVVGPRQDPRTLELFHAALKSGRPNLAVILHDPADGAPKNPDLGFPPLKKPAAFLCGKGTCSSPLTTAEAVLEAAR